MATIFRLLLQAAWLILTNNDGDHSQKPALTVSAESIIFILYLEVLSKYSSQMVAFIELHRFNCCPWGCIETESIEGLETSLCD